MIHASRVGLVHLACLLFAAALVGRAAQVQLLETSAWRARARLQQVAASAVPAPRGRILDATGAPLVESRELVKLHVAPREVALARGKRGVGARRLDTLARALAHAGVSQEWVARAVDTTRKWVTIPGRFPTARVAALTAIRGVHTEPAMERVPATADGLRRLIGRVDETGTALDGLEKALDEVLRGTPGRAALARDARGARFDSPAFDASEAEPGHTVTLTIHQGLQDIAERALGDAVRQMRATGGDVVMLDPLTGEIRAMASRRTAARAGAATALTEPYEPGSTLKPFIAARLLDLGRARTSDVVNTHNGRFRYGGRTITDDHPAPRYSLADVIRYSSNIGIVQFAERLSAAEEYELLRDLGFGSPTGVPYPAESPGLLRPPERWDRMTPASLAMGYALSVTPVQLAAAYAAIATGGELLEPALVKEIRAPDGTVTYRHAPRVLRRVMTPETARTVRTLLRGVVESGTAESANLATFDVAGKTGTARRAEHGRYAPGKYTASFVGLFPADAPQLVILVKLDDPAKTIYGGKAAAPVSKTLLEAAIAAREASLDRRDLAAAPDGNLADADSLVRVADAGSVPYVVTLGAPPARPAKAAALPRAVPNVRGLSLRRAVHALHRAGFRVSLVGTGGTFATVPAAGAGAPAGALVRLFRAP